MKINVHILWGFVVQSVHEFVLRKKKLIESIVEFALKCFFFITKRKKYKCVYLFCNTDRIEVVR